MKQYLLAYAFLISIVGCNKTEGPGGTASIQGLIKEKNYTEATFEVTEVVFTPGINLEHGDYWILNGPIGETQFYIFYDNPTWVSEADPNLEGRTGISVSFNYSDSNVEVAQNTMTAVTAATGASFNIEINTDILSITSNVLGDATDADKVTTPFEINISQQGKDQIIGVEAPAVDEKVYLVYGDNTVYGELTRTGGNGEYKFDHLTKGSYKVYAVSNDTLEGGTITISKSIEITENKTIVIAEEIQVLK